MAIKYTDLEKNFQELKQGRLRALENEIDKLLKQNFAGKKLTKIVFYTSYQITEELRMDLKLLYKDWKIVFAEEGHEDRRDGDIAWQNTLSFTGGD